VTSSLTAGVCQHTRIDTIVGNLCDDEPSRRRDDLHRASTVTRIRRSGLSQRIRLGLFNARSVGDKSANIQRWVTDGNINIAALVETWHDDASSPQLVACAPSGFEYLEKTRPRSGMLSTAINNGGYVYFAITRCVHLTSNYRPTLTPSKLSPGTFTGLVLMLLSSSCTAGAHGTSPDVSLMT